MLSCLVTTLRSTYICRQQVCWSFSNLLVGSSVGSNEPSTSFWASVPCVLNEPGHSVSHRRVCAEGCGELQVQNRSSWLKRTRFQTLILDFFFFWQLSTHIRLYGEFRNLLFVFFKVVFFLFPSEKQKTNNVYHSVK